MALRQLKGGREVVRAEVSQIYLYRKVSGVEIVRNRPARDQWVDYAAWLRKGVAHRDRQLIAWTGCLGREEVFVP